MSIKLQFISFWLSNFNLVSAREGTKRFFKGIWWCGCQNCLVNNNLSSHLLMLTWHVIRDVHMAAYYANQWCPQIHNRWLCYWCGMCASIDDEANYYWRGNSENHVIKSLPKTNWYHPGEAKLKLVNRNNTNWSLMLKVKINNQYGTHSRYLPTFDIQPFDWH